MTTQERTHRQDLANMQTVMAIARALESGGATLEGSTVLTVKHEGGTVRATSAHHVVEVQSVDWGY